MTQSTPNVKVTAAKLNNPKSNVKESGAICDLAEEVKNKIIFCPNCKTRRKARVTYCYDETLKEKRIYD